MKRLLYVTAFMLMYGAAKGSAQIDSQWRGPGRDGIYPNESLLKQWPAEGPPLLWSATGLGEGFSSAAVTAERVYVTGMTGGTGYLYALDSKGNLLWKSQYGAEWDGSHPGARTTPTVAGDRIYIMSAHGSVSCFDSAGKVVWSVDLIKDFKARNQEWGMTESLLIDGDRLFCTPGGPAAMMVALNRFSGATLWTVEGNRQLSGYCSPILINHGGRRLLITMTARAVVGVDAERGTFYWQQPHVTDYDVNANTPLYQNGYVCTVSGYGTGCQLFKLSADGTKIEPVWQNRMLDSQYGAVVLVDGYIYGSGHNNRGWHCLDWKTGEVRFSERAIGNKGNILYADGMLYCYSERGDVALVRPNPGKFELVSSFRMTSGSGPHWAHPVIRAGRLYVRHGEVLDVYDISRK